MRHGFFLGTVDKLADRGPRRPIMIIKLKPGARRQCKTGNLPCQTLATENETFMRKESFFIRLQRLPMRGYDLHGIHRAGKALISRKNTRRGEEDEFAADQQGSE